MNRRLLSVFFFALVIAGVASFLLYQLLSAQIRAAPRRAAPSVKIIVAAHDLQVGSLVRKGDLQQISYYSPVAGETLNKSQDIVGRGVVATIYKGEPIIEKRLAPKGAGAGLAATIPVGMRAVALRVNDVVGLAGFVLPGMRVDVLVSGGQGEMVTRTILQNIEVLSAGQHYERKIDNKPEEVQVVNLLVKPNQAETLSLASNESKVQLVLRNPLDTQEAATQGTSTAKLFGIAAPARDVPISYTPRVKTEPQKIAKIEPKAPVVEVFTGAKKSEQAIDGSGGSN